MRRINVSGIALETLTSGASNRFGHPVSKGVSGSSTRIPKNEEDDREASRTPHPLFLAVIISMVSRVRSTDLRLHKRSA
jgi:hypothetical protein